MSAKMGRQFYIDNMKFFANYARKSMGYFKDYGVESRALLISKLAMFRREVNHIQYYADEMRKEMAHA